MEVGLYYEGCSLRFWIRSEMTGEVGWSWQVSPAVFSAQKLCFTVVGRVYMCLPPTSKPQSLVKPYYLCLSNLGPHSLQLPQVGVRTPWFRPCCIIVILRQQQVSDLRQPGPCLVGVHFFTAWLFLTWTQTSCVFCSFKGRDHHIVDQKSMSGRRDD